MDADARAWRLEAVFDRFQPSDAEPLAFFAALADAPDRIADDETATAHYSAA